MTWTPIQLVVHQLLFVSLPFLLLLVCLSLETDTISSNLVIKDPDTIVSQNQAFKLGFFTLENTTNRYLGIFHAFSEKTPVWIANRNRPLLDYSSTLTISKHGNLVLLNSRNQTVWSTHLPNSSSPLNTTLQIMDSGNLVLREQDLGTTLWQSFSHPSNCFLPTMKIFDYTKTGKRVTVSTWKNRTDPQVGSYTSGLEALPIPQIFIWSNGRPVWRSGQWNGLIFMGIQSMYDSYLDLYNVVDDHAGTVYFTSPEGKNMVKLCVNTSGFIVQSVWDDQKRSWDAYWIAPGDECGFYGRCGPFGSCNVLDSPICSCLRGFEPVKKDEWERGNWSSGCQRKNQLQCNGDGFLRMPFMKVPDFAEPFPGRGEDECLSICSRNCSCIAYAHDPDIGCMLWSDTLIDVQKFTRRVGVDLHIRLLPLELDNHKYRKLYIIIPAVVGFASVSIFSFVAWCWIVKRRGNKIQDKETLKAGQTLSTDSTAIVLKDESENVNFEQLPLVTFETLANATDNFHDNNLLGKDGFGSVYKGNLADGKEIAVKRLSEASRQGVQEFKNEVIVISKLQHRNLVRLLGCCIENEEKMLIYEYMPNKSLDICLFDHTHPSQNVLDWTKRFSIIEGICRGLLYLHRDSRLRIIHRDLKPSNVLLDEDWNPKISDFGIARMFGGNQDHANTSRVVGTYGYMAPEYAIEGRFSEKSDVYSFGVLVLQIATGRKNTRFYHQDGHSNLTGYVWKLWEEGNLVTSIDPKISSPSNEAEVVRCINIGLLCVQESPQYRPSVSAVLSMLSSEIIKLPEPKQPAFTMKSSRCDAGKAGTSYSQQSKSSCSLNNVTLTVVEGR
ncbi:hypothetical protein ACS0TY_026465 [Phlomoides rotata]